MSAGLRHLECTLKDLGRSIILLAGLNIPTTLGALMHDPGRASLEVAKSYRVCVLDHAHQGFHSRLISQIFSSSHDSYIVCKITISSTVSIKEAQIQPILSIPCRGVVQLNS